MLRAIVTSIDEHGLKKRHLKRHVNAVEAFFMALERRSYESDASNALRERLIKNRERLFTFLHHDGVPRNNNLAENAMRRISNFREDAGRSIKDTGLTEHLVLLSLYQTCRIRDVSFLGFLLSRIRDLDAYRGGGKRGHRRAPPVELYPRGYTPPAIVALRQGNRKA